MKIKKRRQIKPNNERVLFSDVLPFETPAIFSNRGFCNFLRENGVKKEGNIITWEKNDKILENILKLLFGLLSKIYNP